MLDMNELKRNVSSKLSLSKQAEALDEKSTDIVVPAGRGVVKSRQLASIGPSIHFKGELTGEEGLMIDGSIEGTIDLKENELLVGPNGNIKADVFAKTIKVDGKLTGELHGTDKVHISKTGEVTGNIHSPRVVIEDGARFKGSIDMTGKVGTTGRTPENKDKQLKSV